MKILQFPLVRIFIGFLFGILLYRIVSPNPIFVFSCLAFGITSLFFSSFYSLKNQFFKVIFGCCVFIVSFLFGISTALIHKENANPFHYTNQITNYEKVHNLDLILVEKLKNTQKNNRYVSVFEVLDGERSYGKVVLNIVFFLAYFKILRSYSVLQISLYTNVSCATCTKACGNFQFHLHL